MMLCSALKTLMVPKVAGVFVTTAVHSCERSINSSSIFHIFYLDIKTIFPLKLLKSDAFVLNICTSGEKNAYNFGPEILNRKSYSFHLLKAHKRCIHVSRKFVITALKSGLVF